MESGLGSAHGQQGSGRRRALGLLIRCGVSQRREALVRGRFLLQGLVEQRGGIIEPEQHLPNA